MSKKTKPVRTAFTGGNTVPPTTTYKYVEPAYAWVHLPMLTEADVPDTTLMQALHKALRLRRTHESATEASFVAWLVSCLPVTMIDAAGNIHVDLRTDPSHRTMFTSHTDTVHRAGGINNIRIDRTDPERIKWRADEGACLGADDGAGIALMMHMIDCAVPGLYVFFRGEECGGVGSSWLAKHLPEAVDDIDRCVSLDRADYGDVITAQAGGRCCSTTFAEALAQELTPMDMSLGYLPCDTGVFTDSANLIGLIPECTNLSVGYKHQHGDGEWQDVSFLQRLADQLVCVPWDTLPTERDPRVRESRYYQGWGNSFGHEFDSPCTVPTTTSEYKGRPKHESDLINALWAASDRYYTRLKDIIAEWQTCEPAGPTFEAARRALNHHNLTDREYSAYAEELENNCMTYDEVMQELIGYM